MWKMHWWKYVPYSLGNKWVMDAYDDGTIQLRDGSYYLSNIKLVYGYTLIKDKNGLITVVDNVSWIYRLMYKLSVPCSAVISLIFGLLTRYVIIGTLVAPSLLLITTIYYQYTLRGICLCSGNVLRGEDH